MKKLVALIYVAGAAVTGAAAATIPRDPNTSAGEHFAVMVGLALAWPFVLVLAAADLAADAKAGAV